MILSEAQKLSLSLLLLFSMYHAYLLLSFRSALIGWPRDLGLASLFGRRLVSPAMSDVKLEAPEPEERDREKTNSRMERRQFESMISPFCDSQIKFSIQLGFNWNRRCRRIHRCRLFHLTSFRFEPSRLLSSTAACVSSAPLKALGRPQSRFPLEKCIDF